MDATKLKIRALIEAAWNSYTKKLAGGIVNPDNEKMMQLQLAMILQTISTIYEYQNDE